MNKIIIIILMLLSSIPYKAYAIDDASKKKYPYTLLNDDYNILNEKDLNDGMKPEPYSPNDITGHIYWQCYPRDHVTTTLKDIGYSSADLADNDGALSITAYSKSGVSNVYGVRRNWPIPGPEKRFHRWLELMKDEKYVCLAGRGGVLLEEKMIKGKKHQVYYWTFEKIKTSKGCNSYFVPINCLSTHSR